MSKSWKNQKPSRISRFLTEFQQSSKRGGSLVVETGFPTSLIDLFVKNRDRLQKSSTKRHQREIQTASNVSSPINPDVIFEKPAKKETVEKVNFVGGGLTAENKRVINQKRCVCTCGVGVNGACVLMAFKVLIVAVLALNMKKKLTIGITLATFALLLTEFVAARVLKRLNRCKTNTHKEKLVVSIQDKNIKTETFDVKKDNLGKEIQIPEPSTKSISCREETELVVKSISKDLKIRDLLLKNEKSRSQTSRLKSKIVKKLKSLKKKNKKKETNMVKEESLTEVSSLVSEIIETEREEKEPTPPLTESKGVNTNGIVVIVIVLTGLLSGKILAIVLTLSCLFLRFGAAKKSVQCI